jgi:hypothetical protein
MKTLEQIEIEKSSFSIGTAFSQGWSYVSKNLMYYILGGIITMVISIVTGFIPIVGTVVNSLILTPCLSAGAIYVTWQISNGKGWTDFADMFKGFKFLTPLMVSTLIQGLILLILGGLILMSYLPDLIQLIKLSSGRGAINNQEEIKDLLMGFLNMKSVILLLVVVLIALFISIIWTFKSHFIIVYNMQAWPAMEASRKVAMRNFFELLGLYILLGLIAILSAIPCGLGLLFTLPWMIGTVYSAFAQITESHKAYDIQNEGFDFLKAEEDDAI